MTDYNKGDTVVWETTDGYTTLGVIEELPPWGFETIDVSYDDRVKMRLSDNIPSYQAVKVDDIRGLESEVEADVHSL